MTGDVSVLFVRVAVAARSVELEVLSTLPRPTSLFVKVLFIHSSPSYSRTCPDVGEVIFTSYKSDISSAPLRVNSTQALL